MTKTTKKIATPATPPSEVVQATPLKKKKKKVRKSVTPRIEPAGTPAKEEQAFPFVEVKKENKVVLVTVYDKTAVTEFMKGLNNAGWEVWSCGGTLKKLTEEGVPAKDVGDIIEAGGQITKLFNGGIKTLQPAVHGGVLASSPEERAELAAHGLCPIDMVVCNMAPGFDIGGSALLRCAAKNHARVITASHHTQYHSILSMVTGTQPWTTHYTRKYLASKALEATSLYDTQLAKNLDPAPVKPVERFSGLSSYIEVRHHPFF
eukprot:TRINITY_DN291_c2_g1_i1.p1 TRINITY_DN291_c2_g1~~TRINITY_DN291_c2_g1_i1.p1  ORF type:complete len:262 (+),score=45.48 TRINITY_DN291_c2_g1_i1:51-836(+)